MTIERLLEIRTYRVVDGQRDEFGRRMAAVAPMLIRYGIDLVGQGPSTEDDEHYVLLRSFASSDERDRLEDAFYGEEEWIDGPRSGIMELIETYHTVVLRITDEAVRALSNSLASGTGPNLKERT